MYPAIYNGSDIRLDQVLLSFKNDVPGLALGYKLPAMHIAIRVVK